MRASYRDEDWNTRRNHRQPHLRFDTFRTDASGHADNFFFDSGFWFQDQRKQAIDRAYIGYHVNRDHQIQIGAPEKPFGLAPVRRLAGPTLFCFIPAWR